VRSSLPETRRFERAAESGSVAATRHARSLPRPLPTARARIAHRLTCARSVSSRAHLHVLSRHQQSRAHASRDDVILWWRRRQPVGTARRGLDRWGRRPTLATLAFVRRVGVATTGCPRTSRSDPVAPWRLLRGVSGRLMRTVAERCLDTELRRRRCGRPTRQRASVRPVATIRANWRGWLASVRRHRPRDHAGGPWRRRCRRRIFRRSLRKHGQGSTEPRSERVARGPRRAGTAPSAAR
jgi:hypothetical protein